MAKKAAQPRYTVVIQWSEEDDRYIVSLPEWGQYASTHGATIEEAAKNAREVLELLLDGEESPPAPKLFHYPGADVIDMPEPVPAQSRGQSNTARPKRRSA